MHSCERLQNYKTLSLLKTGLGICLYIRWRSSLRLSLKDILNAVDMSAEFAWRKKLWFEIGKTEVEETLKNCESNCLVPFFKSCGKEGFAMQILEVLDEGTHNLIFSLWPSAAWSVQRCMWSFLQVIKVMFYTESDETLWYTVFWKLFLILKLFTYSQLGAICCCCFLVNENRKLQDDWSNFCVFETCVVLKLRDPRS